MSDLSPQFKECFEGLYGVRDVLLNIEGSPGVDVPVDWDSWDSLLANFFHITLAYEGTIYSVRKELEDVADVSGSDVSESPVEVDDG